MTTQTTIKPFSRTWGGWPGVVGVIAGLGLIVAPFLFNFDGGTPIGTNAIITGAAIAIFSAISAFGYGHMQQMLVRVFSWLAALAGVWAVISSFVLGYVQGSSAFYIISLPACCACSSGSTRRSRVRPLRPRRATGRYGQWRLYRPVVLPCPPGALPNTANPDRDLGAESDSRERIRAGIDAVSSRAP
jgi:hypothetical protein